MKVADRLFKHRLLEGDFVFGRRGILVDLDLLPKSLKEQYAVLVV